MYLRSSQACAAFSSADINLSQISEHRGELISTLNFDQFVVTETGDLDRGRAVWVDAAEDLYV